MSSRRGQLGAVLAGTLLLDALPSVTAIAPLRRGLAPRLSGQASGAAVALTFDDGPDPEGTPAVLDILAVSGTTATFFLLGTAVRRWPDLARDIVDAGHEVAVHGWDHRCLLLQPPTSVRDSLRRAWEAVGETTGTAATHHRPTYGISNSRGLLAARSLGMRTVLWTAAGREWQRGSTAATVRAHVAGDLGPGGTVLLHDSDCSSPPGSARAAREALPGIIADCADRGLPLGSLAARGDKPRSGSGTLSTSR